MSIFTCVGAFVCLLWLLRRDGASLGLPIAYLALLLLNHLPGAIAHTLGADFFLESDSTEIGIKFTAIGACCFVVGAWLARSTIPKMRFSRDVDRVPFQQFCLVGGWLFTYALTPLNRIPSLGAAAEKSSAIWMLGVMLGLRAATQRRDLKLLLIWIGALAVYPILMLLLGGFLSYGTAAIIIVLSILTISTASRLRVLVGVTIVAVLGFNLFLSYFQSRDQIRDAVWGGAPLSNRVDASTRIVTDFTWFDPRNKTQLGAIDERLNQNNFVGLAAARIAQGTVPFLYGRSILEGALGLVPRALWPDKPVFAGSPQIVAEMTGLQLSRTTSWGVGNVMEFYINFGIPGLIGGFLTLGWLLGGLDRKAALAEGRGDFGRTLIFFLPAVALIQPLGSMVEMTSGAAAALVGALGWRRAWKWWNGRRSHTRKMHGTRTVARVGR